MTLLIGGCPKRQSGTRLVYVPTPAAAPSARSAPDSGTLSIEEPAPPEPVVVQAPAPPVASQAPQTKTRSRSTGRAATSTEPPSEPPADEPTPIKPPALEPADGLREVGRRQKLEKTQRDLGVRVAQFENRSLSEPEVRTLTGARAFLAQSVHALNEGDLQRADNLAHKADLLITALEKGP